jgi:hypothetical protein
MHLIRTYIHSRSRQQHWKSCPQQPAAAVEELPAKMELQHYQQSEAPPHIFVAAALNCWPGARALNQCKCNLQGRCNSLPVLGTDI